MRSGTRWFCMTAPPDRLQADLHAALDRLADVLEVPKNDIVRDASIQRFEFAFELFWKSLKTHAESQGLRVFSPRESLRAAFKLGLVEDEEAALRMLEDRNRTTHLYRVAMAEEVFARIPEYQALMASVCRRLGGPVDSSEKTTE